MKAAKCGWKVLINAVMEMGDNVYTDDYCIVKLVVNYIEKEWMARGN